MTLFPHTRARQHQSSNQRIRVPVPATDRARTLERAFDQLPEQQRSLLQPTENVRTSRHLSQEAMARSGRLVFGRVVYAVPYVHWYRVALDGVNTDCAACTLTETAPQPFSVVNTSPIPPGAAVLVWLPGNTAYGVILGCLPSLVFDETRTHADWLFQGGNSGFKREAYYKDLMTVFGGNAGLFDFSDSRPLDATSLGEWGRMTDLGGGIWMDALVQFLRGDESCGLSLFYMDRLARLAGHNLDITTAISERMVRDDNGEGLDYAGYTPYPWEALGAAAAGRDVARAVEPQDVHFEKPYGVCEPLQDDQQPFYRYEEYRGYLGQAFMRQVVLPPSSPGAVYRYADQDVRPGVFREHLGLDGSLAIASAHSISFVKQLVLPSPKRVKPPEDPTGDDLAVQGSSDNPGYRFAGQYGSNGSEHKIQDAPRPGSVLPNLRTAAGLRDFMAYTLNWKGLHAFHYHQKDFHTPEESGMGYAPMALPDLASLRSQQWLSAPQAVEQTVDHRYGAAKYYPRTAGVHLLPDGSVVIRSGCGCEIRMSGGSIQMSAPADVWSQAGRNVIQYAGDDAVVRARNSVDMTASLHDVRLKAERNLELLGGNSGTGRLLLDCRSTGAEHDVVGKEGEDLADHGLILRCAEGELVQWAKDFYLRSIGGDIVMDADAGGGHLQVSAGTVQYSLQDAARFAFLGSEDNPICHELSAESVLLPTPLEVQGDLRIRGQGIVCRGDIRVIGGTVSTDGSSDGHMGIIEPGGDEFNFLSEYLQEARDDFWAARDASLEAQVTALLDRWYPEKQAGYATVIDNTQFAPRNLSQMGTENFQLPEVYHQELLRALGTGAAWAEPDIVYQGLHMAPHPGRQKWREQAVLLQNVDKLSSLTSGLAEDRASRLYEDPDLPDWNYAVPAEGYLVTLE